MNNKTLSTRLVNLLFYVTLEFQQNFSMGIPTMLINMVINSKLGINHSQMTD